MGKKNAALVKIYFIMFAVCLSASGLSFAEDSLSLQEFFHHGKEAFEERRYQDAINYFEGAIDVNDRFAPAYHALGLVYQQTSSDPYYPLWYFETALEIDPNFVPAHDLLCRSYYQVQEYVQAEEFCLKALELNPNLVGSQLSLAWVYLVGRSDADHAIYYFEKVVEHIKAPPVYFGLGMAYAMNGDHGKVLDIITFLRSEGVEDFAAHLEAVIRSKTLLKQFMPPGFLKGVPSPQVARKRQDKFNADVRKIIPVPIPVVVRPKITGSPKIHIKGRIKPPQIRFSEPKTYGGQTEKHPGSLGE